MVDCQACDGPDLAMNRQPRAEARRQSPGAIAGDVAETVQSLVASRGDDPACIRYAAEEFCCRPAQDAAAAFRRSARYILPTAGLRVTIMLHRMG